MKYQWDNTKIYTKYVNQLTKIVFPTWNFALEYFMGIRVSKHIVRTYFPVLPSPVCTSSAMKRTWEAKKMVHLVLYRKIAKISPGLIFFKGPFWGAYFWRGLSTEGNLHFKIDWVSLVVGSWKEIYQRVFCVTSLGGLVSEFYGI